MGGTLRQEGARSPDRRDQASAHVIHRLVGPLMTRSPRVALYVAHLPLASAVPVIPGAPTRENVEPREYARQRRDDLPCGRTWG
jgi:hypothetical protein